MKQIIFDSTKEDFLYMLYNDMGATDLAVSYNYVKDNSLRFSKWVRYNTLMHLDFKDRVPGLPYFMTKQRFISKVTHRTVLDIELMIDVDDNLYHFGLRTMPNIFNKSVSIYDRLRDGGFQPVMYWTQNKSFHISVIIPELRGLSKYYKEQFKEQVLDYYGGDMMKKSSRCMIAMENSIHYKSGKIKIRV